MPNDTPKLKPCPCCGDVAFTHESFWGKFYVECYICGLRTAKRRRAEQAEADWNRRTHE